MSKCPNCGSAITCGCQRRTLTNGRAGCTKCLGKAPKADQTGPVDGNEPTINSAELKKD